MMPTTAAIGVLTYLLFQVLKKHAAKSLDALPGNVQAMLASLLAVCLSVAANRLGLPIEPGDAIAAALSAVGTHGLTKLDWTKTKAQAESEGDGER